MNKKILFISQYFYPEEFRGNDIAFDWVERGDNVTVITGIPNYPKGHFFDGYGLFNKRREIIKGVRVIRIPVIPRGNGRGFILLLNYLSFALFASVFAFFHSFNEKYDIVFVQQLSPVTMALPAVVIKKCQKIPLVLWVLDLWPESLTSAGNINNKLILDFFKKIVTYIYQNSDKILISSKSFRNSILEKGNYSSKIKYLPNWADTDFLSNKKIDIIPNIPEGFNVMFAGNIGEAQDFENILKAAEALRDCKRIKFIILGDGRKKVWVENYCKTNNLEDTVICLGRFPIETMSSFFEKADIMLLTLKDEPTFNMTLPAKAQSYMMSGRPIVGMVNGEGKRLINEANCGLCVDAGDYLALSECIKSLSEMNSIQLKKLGENGKQYALANFDKSILLNQLYKVIDSIISIKL